MITEKQILESFALNKDCIDLLSYTNGATWAMQQLDPLCTSAAEMIEKLQAVISAHEQVEKAHWAEYERLQAENEKLNDILEKINAVMWKSYMVKDRGIKDSDCDSIMELLEEWAKIDS